MAQQGLPYVLTYVIMPTASYLPSMLDPLCPNPQPRLSLDGTQTLLAYSGTVPPAALAAGTVYTPEQVQPVLASLTWTPSQGGAA